MSRERSPSVIVQPPGFGEMAPLFAAATDGNPQYHFSVAGGRWLILMFFGTLSQGAIRNAHDLAKARSALFNDADAAFFGVSVDPSDRAQRGLANVLCGWRYFWDFDRAVSRLYGLVQQDALQPAIFLIDPAMRVVAAEPIEQTEAVLDLLAGYLAKKSEFAQAPVLTLPRLFEPEFCERLIAYYQTVGGTVSGFARDTEGRTTNVIDPRLKRRADVFIEDEALISELRMRLETRLFPMVRRAFAWQAVYIERYLVSAYDLENSGFFSAHRDDVTTGTAHRKFAVTVNLNADQYEGGDLRFPEFGPRTYRPSTGGATIFSCNLLHEVTPVTKGMRYAFIPFLYDEDGARLRRKNLSRVDTEKRRARV